MADFAPARRCDASAAASHGLSCNQTALLCTAGGRKEVEAWLCRAATWRRGNKVMTPSFGFCFFLFVVCLLLHEPGAFCMRKGGDADACNCEHPLPPPGGRVERWYCECEEQHVSHWPVWNRLDLRWRSRSSLPWRLCQVEGRTPALSSLSSTKTGWLLLWNKHLTSVEREKFLTMWIIMIKKHVCHPHRSRFETRCINGTRFRDRTSS